MSFIVPANFRQLPPVWEIAQPFRIDPLGQTLASPRTTPNLNWSQQGADPPNWDPDVLYKGLDAVYFNAGAWYANQNNEGISPGTAIVDPNDPTGNTLITPWTLLPSYNTGTGAVAYDTDPVAWARNHILAILLTNPGERVMRPNYGVGVYRFVWENQDPFYEQGLITQIRQAVAAWEPEIALQEVTFDPTMDPLSGEVLLHIAFSVGGLATVHTVSFTLGGSGVEVAV